MAENTLQQVTPQAIEQIIYGLTSTDPTQQLKSTQAACTILSTTKKNYPYPIPSKGSDIGEMNPAIAAMIEAGVINLLMGFLCKFENPGLQFEAAWALTNILAFGTSDHINAVVASGAVPIFIQLLSCPDYHVSNQAAWALGCIVEDGSALKDFVIAEGALAPLLQLINPDGPYAFMAQRHYNVAWTLSNLCRNRNPSPPFEMFKTALPAIATLIRHDAKIVQAEACRALSYISDSSNEGIQELVNAAGVIPQLVMLLKTDDLTVVTPALRTIGNIVKGNDSQKDEVIKAGALSVLPKLMDLQNVNINKDAAWTISNVLAGNVEQIQAVIDADLIRYLNNIMNDILCESEAAQAVTNYIAGGSTAQIIYLVIQDILKPFCNLLERNNAERIMVVLDGISNILEKAEKMDGTDRKYIRQMLEKCGALDKIKNLKKHINKKISEKSLELISIYNI